MWYIDTRVVMARSGIQFQKDLSLPDFQKLYGTEAHCGAAMEKARWPDGFRSPRCDGHQHGEMGGKASYSQWKG